VFPYPKEFVTLPETGRIHGALSLESEYKKIVLLKGGEQGMELLHNCFVVH
jgi:hypothetical protein